MSKQEFRNLPRGAKVLFKLHDSRVYGKEGMVVGHGKVKARQIYVKSVGLIMDARPDDVELIREHKETDHAS